MAEESSERYAGRGVSSTKAEVHQAIKKIDKGLYPQAFCKVIPDVLTNDPDYAIVMHADGACFGWLGWVGVRAVGVGRNTPARRWPWCAWVLDGMARLLGDQMGCMRLL
jgi:hypothetical protein